MKVRVAPNLVKSHPVREDVRIVIPSGLIRLVPLLAAIIGSLITVLIYSFSSGQWFGKNIPDRVQVDKQIADAVAPLAKQIAEATVASAEMKKYVDAKSAAEHDFTIQQITQAMKQVTDHSDLNRESMRGDTKAITERVDSVKDQVKNLSGSVDDLAKRFNDFVSTPVRSRMR